jgi:hypothetical protein
MPGRNGTGPAGQGSRTGRGMGNCTPAQTTPTNSSIPQAPKSIGWFGRIWNSAFGRGAGRRRGRRSNQR